MKLRVKDVAKAAKQTSRLTQQLLSMEHISQRSIKSEFKDVDLVKITQEILTKFALRADKQKVNLSLTPLNNQFESLAVKHTWGRQLITS